MNAAPPSICDKSNHLKFDRKSYGQRLKFRPVLDRKNMPKFDVDFNVFGDNDFGVVTDMKWQCDENNECLIPSDFFE